MSFQQWSNRIFLTRESNNKLWVQTKWGRLTFKAERDREMYDEWAIFGPTKEEACYDRSYCLDNDMPYNTALMELKISLVSIMQPSTERCSMLLLTNLADPQWVSVNCAKQTISDVVCVSPHATNDYGNLTHQYNPLSCAPVFVVARNICVVLQHYAHNMIEIGRPLTMCNQNKLQLIDLQDIHTISALLESLKFFHLALLVHHMKISALHALQYVEHVDNFVTFSPTADQTNNLYCLCKSKHPPNKTNSLLSFQCRTKLISTYSVFDGQDDCHDAFSESQNSSMSSDEVPFKCGGTPNRQFPRHQINCSCALFFQTIRDECSSYTEALFIKEPKDSFFTCNNFRKIHQSFLEDLVPDCEMAEDERYFQTFNHFSERRWCNFPNQIPCREGHQRCFNFSHLCLFSFNTHGHFAACRSGEHLQNCAQFECNAQFKCPNFYCIPHKYVCNGRIDCPHGEDEGQVCLNSMRCTSMIHCKQSDVCVHPRNLCDGMFDCPLFDDESMCKLADTICPQDCFCFHLAVMCTGKTLHQANLDLSSFQAVFISHCGIKTLQLITLHSSLVLDVSHNLLKYVWVEHLSNAVKLQHLDVGNNSVGVVHNFCFSHNTKLRKVLLDHNRIFLLGGYSFHNLTSLEWIDISFNRITILPGNLFRNSSKLIVVILKGNKISSFDPKIFDGLLPSLVVAQGYELCCSVLSYPESCVALDVWLKSCSQTMLTDIMAAILLVYTVVLQVNFCLCLALFSFNKQRAKKLKSRIAAFNGVLWFTLNTNAVSTLILLLLSGANFYFSNSFHHKSINWKFSLLCSLIWGLNILSNLLYATNYSILAVCSLMVVMHPLKSKCKSKKHVMKIHSVGSFLSFVLTSSEVAWLVVHKDTNQLCFPFTKTLESSLGTIIVAQTCCAEVCCLVVTLWSGLLTLQQLSKSQEAVQKQNTPDRLRSVKTKLLISLTAYSAAWIPSSSLNIVSFFWPNPYEAVLWNMVLLTPLCAVLTPFVLTYSSVPKLFHLVKISLPTGFKNIPPE